MGPHFENFRDAVELPRGVDALRVVERAGVGKTIAEWFGKRMPRLRWAHAGRKHLKSRRGRRNVPVDAVVRLLSEGNV